jgi:hypothetical protein
MASNGVPVDRLRDYLRELKPAARALLMAELERGRLRNDELPALGLILRELREAAPHEQALPQRIGDPQRLLFAPLEPFLVDDRSGRKRPGRIARMSLDPIWRWLSTDLMPAETSAYAEETKRLLLAGDADQAEARAFAFAGEVAARIEAALAALHGDARARRRLAGRIGTPNALEELGDVLAVFKTRDILAALAARLAPHIGNLADEQLTNVNSLLASELVQRHDLFLFTLLLVQSRLGSRWHLLRIAVRSAETDVAARIAQTPAALAITLVLDDMELQAMQLREALETREIDRVIVLLKDIHDAARGMRTELDLSGDQRWGRQLAAVRAEVSAAIETQIVTVPGRVHRLLRPRAKGEGVVLDLQDVAEVEALIDLVNACRTYAAELAVNEATLRVQSQLQHYLDTGMAPLLDGLRQAGPAERALRQAQVDAAVRFAAKIFGSDYAAVLLKAADVAAHGTDPKAAKA